MKIAVWYATREGQTRRIAEHVARGLRAQQLEVDVLDVATLVEPAAFDGYGAGVIAASVHLGKHEREMVQFVRRHRDALARLPCAFLSVSMSEAGVEDAARTPKQRADAAAYVREVLDTFFKATGWRPAHVFPVAGALLYTKYNALVRWILKMISKRTGGPTDTTRDYEMTDWDALDRFVGNFVDALAPPA